MSNNTNQFKFGLSWPADVRQMHAHFKVYDVVNKFDEEKLRKFLEFRANFLQEELDELKEAKTADDVVDALIDLCVIAITTLDLYQVNADESWDRVWRSNMKKVPGVKESRPNPLGLPDLIKPKGWKAPHHYDNVGLLAKILPVGDEAKD